MLRRSMVIVLCTLFFSGPITTPGIAQTRETAPSRQEHEQAMDERLTELDREMDKLAAGIRQTEKASQAELNRLYDEFKHKQSDARKDLEEMRNATNKRWDQLKVEMNKSIEDLNQLYEQAKSRTKEEGKPSGATK